MYTTVVYIFDPQTFLNVIQILLLNKEEKLFLALQVQCKAWLWWCSMVLCFFHTSLSPSLILQFQVNTNVYFLWEYEILLPSHLQGSTIFPEHKFECVLNWEVLTLLIQTVSERHQNCSNSSAAKMNHKLFFSTLELGSYCPEHWYINTVIWHNVISEHNHISDLIPGSIREPHILGWLLRKCSLNSPAQGKNI